MKRARTIITAAAILMGQGVVHATPILFDFEDQPDTHDSGAYSSMSITRMGLTMTITRLGQTPDTSVFDFGNFTGFAPASWGMGTLDPFFKVDFTIPPPGYEHPRSVFVLDFSQPIYSFSAEFGDKKPSDLDSPVTMVAFGLSGGVGPVIDVSTEFWLPDQGFPVDGSPPDAPGVISVAGNGIHSIAFSSGNFTPTPQVPYAYSNTLLWDNFRVGVPDGGTTVALLGLSLLGLSAFKRAAKQ